MRWDLLSQDSSLLYFSLPLTASAYLKRDGEWGVWDCRAAPGLSGALGFQCHQLWNRTEHWTACQALRFPQPLNGNKESFGMWLLGNFVPNSNCIWRNEMFFLKCSWFFFFFFWWTVKIMEVVAFGPLRSYPSFPRQTNNGLITVEWDVELPLLSSQKRLLLLSTASLFHEHLAWPNVAFYSLISIGFLFSLLVIKRCDTSRLKFKVCIYMKCILENLQQLNFTFDYLCFWWPVYKYWFCECGCPVLCWVRPERLHSSLSAWLWASLLISLIPRAH